MGVRSDRIILYSSQAEMVINALERDEVCFSKEKYVVKKYEESAPIFTAAYHWFVSAAEKYVPKPEGAEYPYWAFTDFGNAEPLTDGKILKLSVPIDEVIFFNMYDWNKILRLKYIGETEAQEKLFSQLITNYGIRRESDVILTNFYPDLKRQVQNSWQRLFRHHDLIKAGNTEDVASVQVGLWQLKKEWII